VLIAAILAGDILAGNLYEPDLTSANRPHVAGLVQGQAHVAVPVFPQPRLFSAFLAGSSCFAGALEIV